LDPSFIRDSDFSRFYWHEGLKANMTAARIVAAVKACSPPVAPAGGLTRIANNSYLGLTHTLKVGDLGEEGWLFW
jgi:hypothetical protein